MSSNGKVKNDIDAVVEAIGRERTGVTVVAESCNGSATFLDQLHLSTGCPVQLCHPGYAQRMRANPDKTDKSDGELIADLTRVGYLPEVWLAPAIPELLCVSKRTRDLLQVRAYVQEEVSILAKNEIFPLESLSKDNDEVLASRETISMEDNGSVSHSQNLIAYLVSYPARFVPIPPQVFPSVTARTT